MCSKVNLELLPATYSVQSNRQMKECVDDDDDDEEDDDVFMSVQFPPVRCVESLHPVEGERKHSSSEALSK